jgi:hypothetical protein
MIPIAGEGAGLAKVFRTSKVILGSEEAAKFATLSIEEYERAVAEADKLYPKLAGKIHEHHVFPMYLGGHGNGPTMKIAASYHQLITNAFRAEQRYGLKRPQVQDAMKILEEVYAKHGLPRR